MIFWARAEHKKSDSVSLFYKISIQLFSATGHYSHGTSHSYFLGT
jgi:hypothetical protein